MNYFLRLLPLFWFTDGERDQAMLPQSWWNLQSDRVILSWERNQSSWSSIPILFLQTTNSWNVLTCLILRYHNRIKFNICPPDRVKNDIECEKLKYTTQQWSGLSPTSNTWGGLRSRCLLLQLWRYCQHAEVVNATLVRSVLHWDLWSPINSLHWHNQARITCYENIG